ncbi:MAG: hypothetical protein R6T99_04430 [Bacteroidales bacterium]
MDKRTLYKILWILTFGIAMGYLEASVVVYLRELYYPGGFAFPLELMAEHIGTAEFFREASTIAMLLAVSILTGRSPTERFALFVIIFAVWDIFYYAFLKLLLGWPDSLLTWDILFLIPVTWVGPVAGPLINSLSMILLGAFLIYFCHRRMHPQLKIREWIMLILGSLLVILSYTLDYTRFMLNEFSTAQLLTYYDSTRLLDHARSYVPRSFNWWIFGAGQIVILFGIGSYIHRMMHRGRGEEKRKKTI